MDRKLPPPSREDVAACLRPDGLIDNDKWRALSRRRFLQAMGVSGSLAAQGLVLGSALGGFARSAQAQAVQAGNAGNAGGGDEHYFIFVELAGGIHWSMGLDARDPTTVKAENVVPFDVRKPWTQQQFNALIAKPQFVQQNGGGYLAPFDGSRTGRWEDSLTAGKTRLGLPYVLGFCGDSLKPFVDQMAVVHGVKMAGNFHGKMNSSDDMWSGSDKGDQPHVASVLAALLEQRNGIKPLDNIVLENAFFPENESVGAKAAIRTDGRTLGLLLSSFSEANRLAGQSPQDRFQRFANVGNAVLAESSTRLGQLQTGVFQTYLAKFAPALSVQGSLLALGSKLGQADISLDLKAQFDLAMTLMESGLTRVMTLCMGAPNATNLADPNGLYDAHTGLYTKEPGGNSTENNWEQITKAMDGIAYAVDRLNKLEDGHPLKGKVTVCITSEFSRQGNTNGNERPSTRADQFVHFGGGHNFCNNNYVFFGKNVRGGCWLGRETPTSLVRYDVDFAKLNATAVEKLMDDASGVFTAPAIESDVVNVSSEPPPATPGGKRGFAARDMLRTALALAGADDQYDKFYARQECKDAQVVQPLKAT